MLYVEQLNDAIKTKRPHLAKKKELFHHNNTPAHTSLIVVIKLHELRFKLLSHSSYSSDFLFPNIKKWFAGRKFMSNEEIIIEIHKCLF